MCLAESYGLLVIVCRPRPHLISKQPMRATVPATQPQTEPRDQRRARTVTLRCGAMADSAPAANDLRTDGPDFFECLCLPLGERHGNTRTLILLSKVNQPTLSQGSLVVNKRHVARSRSTSALRSIRRSPARGG